MSEWLFKLADIYMEPGEDAVYFEDAESLLGEICINRVVGIAYKNIEKNHNLNLPGEFRKSLKAIYKANVEKSEHYRENLKYVASIMNNAEFPYAFLKGTYLSTQLYEIGLRTSNDMDILINENDISKCQILLLENGFIQGSYVENKGVIPATRREIVLSRMNFGETIPFLKVIDGEPLEIDLNFSIDYKPEDKYKIVSELLCGIIDVSFENVTFKTLELKDFFIHLCCHLYKEATTFDWVRRKCDLQLYKFSDINVMFREKFTEEFVDKLIYRINEIGVNKECYYTIYNTMVIYPDIRKTCAIDKLLEAIKPHKLDFMKQIINPEVKAQYYYDLDFKEWFDVRNRVANLKELEVNEV